MLQWSQAAEPFFVGAATGLKSGKGPVWMTIDIGDADKDILKLVLAKVACKKIEGLSAYSDILSADMAKLRFQAGELAQPFHFLWQMPAEFLEQDLITLSFQLQVSDGSKTSPVFEFVERDIDLKSLREKSWIRLKQGGNENMVVTFNPGNYLKYKFNGAGLSAAWGYAPNMGKVQVKESGNVVAGSPFDLYPPGVRADQFPTQASFTQYVKTRVWKQEQRNRDMAFEFKLLNTKNAKSLFTGFALQGLHFEVYERNGVTVTERDVPVMNPDIRLYSTPDPFDASYFMKFFELGLGVTRVEKARMATESNAEEWPAGVIGYKVEVAKWGQELEAMQIISAAGYNTSGWEINQPYRFKVSGLSDLGLAGEPVIDTVLFKLDSSSMVHLSVQPARLKAGGVDVRVATQAESGAEADMQWAVLDNQGKFGQFPADAKVLVLQNPAVSQLDLQLEAEQFAAYNLYALDEQSHEWQLQTVENQIWRGKGRLFVLEPKSATDASNQNNKLQEGGQGGGCLLRRQKI